MHSLPRTSTIEHKDISKFSDIVKLLTPLIHQHQTANLDCFNPQNVAKLSSLCRIIDESLSGDFIPSDDLNIILYANQLRKKTSNVSFEDLRNMKEGASLVLKRQKYKLLIAELNATGENSPLNVAAKKAESFNVNKQFDEIRNTWLRRSKFANYSSKTLLELLPSLDQLEQYLIILNKDFPETSFSSYKRYIIGITNNSIQQIQSIINKIREKIRLHKEFLAEAMLERLLLLPKDVLLDPNSKSTDIYKDDVLYATLASLVDLRIISEAYLRNFVEQSPSYVTLTSHIAVEFSEFIFKNGSRETKTKLTELYKQANDRKYEPYQLPKINLLQSQLLEDWLLIPIKIPGHYNLRLGNSNDFIYIESEKSTAENIDKILGSFVAMPYNDKNSLEVTFLDLGSNERVIIPIIDQFAKISIYDAKIQKMYGLIFDEEYVEKTSSDSFSFYMLDASQEDQLLQVAHKHFSDPENLRFFIQTAKDIASVSRDKNIDNICHSAFIFTTDQIIEILVNVQETSKIIKEAFRRLIKSLRDDYINLKKENFEKFIKADDILSKINSALSRIHENFLSSISPELAESKKQFFISHGFYLFKSKNFNDAFTSVAEAELDIFINICNQDLTNQQMNSVKADILDRQNWQNQPKIWIDILNVYKFKQMVIKDLEVEIARLSENISKIYISKTSTQDKIALLISTIQNIDKVQTIDEVKAYLDKLLSSQTFTQSTNIFKSLTLFSSTSTSSTNVLNTFKSHNQT